MRRRQPCGPPLLGDPGDLFWDEGLRYKRRSMIPGCGGLMRPFTGEFNLTKLERVVSGAGSIDSLGEELDRRSLARAIVVTGKTLGASMLLQRLTKALGPRCALVFTGARQHVPATTVREIVNEAERAEADCLISFGGG